MTTTDNHIPTSTDNTHDLLGLSPDAQHHAAEARRLEANGLLDRTILPLVLQASSLPSESSATVPVASSSGSTPSALSPTPAPAPPPESTRNTLTWRERTKLSVWLDEPATKARAAKESDTLIAKDATTALNFTITPANITSMRHELAIEKIKPEKEKDKEKPAEADITLADLHRRLDSLETAQRAQLPSDPIQGHTTAEVVHELKTRLAHIEELLRFNIKNDYLGISENLRRSNPLCTA